MSNNKNKKQLKENVKQPIITRLFFLRDNYEIYKDKSTFAKLFFTNSNPDGQGAYNTYRRFTYQKDGNGISKEKAQEICTFLNFEFDEAVEYSPYNPCKKSMISNKKENNFI